MKIEMDYVGNIRINEIKQIKTKAGKIFYDLSMVVKEGKTSHLLIFKSFSKEILKALVKEEKND